MDFESPDVMKDFPGLYSTETNKKTNDSDYSDDVNEKVTKKDLLIGKRKDKKDTKKDRGYAALEGESSAEEDEAKSPSKSKKTKSFKFTTKTKEKREKTRDKEKDGDKKKEKDSRKNDKDRTKDKVKCDKKDRKVKSNDEKDNIDEAFPVFGVSLHTAVERSRCHDGVEIPLPLRDCIDYVQEHGITVENVYKTNGIKSKVLQIKKLYNQREHVSLSDYDVPTATSVFKLFFRELPEPILGNFLTRFEEAAAVQNVALRETSLLSLVEKLPLENRTILAWTILHLDTITANDKQTKMNAQGIAMALSPVLQMSHRLLTALLCHCKSLFKNTRLLKYIPPLLSSTMQFPEDAEDISCELRKQESLLSQIHAEMNSGFISKKREELLWEVQRMITQLKRKLRSIQKCHEATNKAPENHCVENSKMTKSRSCSDDDTFQKAKPTKQPTEETTAEVTNFVIVPQEVRIETLSDSDNENTTLTIDIKGGSSDSDVHDGIVVSSENGDEEIATSLVNNVPVAKSQLSDAAISLLQNQNRLLLEMKDTLVSQISAEKSELVLLKYCLANNPQASSDSSSSNHSLNIDVDKLDEIMDLLIKENRILKIKKIDLVREIMEQRESCVCLRSKLNVLSSGVR